MNRVFTMDDSNPNNTPRSVETYNMTICRLCFVTAIMSRQG